MLIKSGEARLDARLDRSDRACFPAFVSRSEDGCFEGGVLAVILGKHLAHGVQEVLLEVGDIARAFYEIPKLAHVDGESIAHGVGEV